jgi:hypothetical protein
LQTMDLVYCREIIVSTTTTPWFSSVEPPTRKK